jgi:hypothetical protein
MNTHQLARALLLKPDQPAILLDTTTGELIHIRTFRRSETSDIYMSND